MNQEGVPLLPTPSAHFQGNTSLHPRDVSEDNRTWFNCFFGLPVSDGRLFLRLDDSWGTFWSDSMTAFCFFLFRFCIGILFRSNLFFVLSNRGIVGKICLTSVRNRYSRDALASWKGLSRFKAKLKLILVADKLVQMLWLHYKLRGLSRKRKCREQEQKGTNSCSGVGVRVRRCKYTEGTYCLFQD